MKNRALFLISMFFLVACNEILLEDISDQKVTILAPIDSLETETFSVVFWWEKHIAIKTHRLQIVSPNFESPSRIVLDTLLSSDKIEQTLSPGNYQWRIRGENESYTTSFETRSLTILSTNDLSQQIVKLIYPSNGSFTNKSQLTFTWEALEIADEYTFVMEDFPSLSVTQEMSTASIDLPEVTDRTYTWYVVARNEESVKRSNTFSFVTDFTIPLSPIITSLNDADTVSNLPYVLNWERRSQDIVRDSIYLYSDNELKQLVEGYPISELNPSHSLSNTYLTLEGKYFLQIRSTDRAGNVSPYSATVSFTYRKEE
ncbi:hypothetical protein QWY31_08135 [Cytophagales bacterium LB-30]|uniref:Uncharacterized protein n=1 Tax=Shiella aurantiaca TaxID=3058365 RepID=A0ABT8F4U1_9BACT|nr:hypothetical protein [Shiella aurantiaca]MDN4165465.1 hypothetical protein [Shiella aurantiaca]